MDELKELLPKYRARHEYHPLVEGQIAYIASRLSDPLHTIAEIHAVRGGVRNDALSTHPTKEILWEVFGTINQIDDDLRKLECDDTAARLKLAVVMDQEIDPKLFEEFTRKRQSSGDRIRWLRVSDLLLSDRIQQTTQALQRWLDELRPRWNDELEAVGFDLAGEHRFWRRFDWVPLAFGCADWQMLDPLEDPTFFLDVRNIGTVEARVTAAYINVRFRQTDLHGIPGEDRLQASAHVRLPLEDGTAGYREVAIPEPVLVKPGAHARVLLTLDDAGFAWCGEVELGVLYGAGRRLQIPAISLFL